MWGASFGFEGLAGVNYRGLREAPAVSSLVSCCTLFVIALTRVGHAAGALSFTVKTGRP